MTIEKARLESVLALLKKGSANADYFFQKLDSAKWIEPLASRKVFSSPYKSIRQGDVISFPVWYPGEYLARMASRSEARDQVVSLLEALPESDNPRVYEAVADAMVSLPPLEAAKLTKQLLRGLVLPYQLALPRKAADVINHLLDDGRVRQGLRLARALFALQTSTPSHRPEGGDGERQLFIHKEVKSRISDWSYGEVLDIVVPHLARRARLDGLRLLCNLLSSAIDAERLTADEGLDDYSYIWRPTIAHERQHGGGIKDSLVSATRDAAEQLVDSDPQSLPAVVDLLHQRKTRVFDRIALSLLDHHGQLDVSLVEDLLRDPTKWADSGLHPEYELLLSHFFGLLTGETQRLYRLWIEAGPDTQRYMEFRERMEGEDPTETEITQHREMWIRDHLFVLRGFLTDEERERLVQFERWGPPQQIGQPHHRVSFGWGGSRSPLSEAETLSIDWPSLIRMAQTWTPSDPQRFDGPSIEGLVGSVRQRVTANPAEAVQALALMVDLQPQYYSAVLEALRDALKEGAPLDWSALLVFVGRTVRQAASEQEQDGGWRWVSKCAASLLDDAFDAGSASVSAEYRTKIWTIIELLTKNPDPTPEHEQRYGGSNMDPATLSLNTVRGEAFHAVLRYSLWWRRHLQSLPDGTDSVSAGFGEMPEVRTVLEAHLDPTFDPSTAVRAVYGQWFPWLQFLDRNWASAKVPIIFPNDPSSVQLFWAACGSYIVYCQPYSDVLELLRPVYAIAIVRLSEPETPEVGMGERPAEHLAAHLAVFYLRGQVSLDPGDLLDLFFENASPTLRGEAIEQLGRIMTNSDNPLPAETVSRLERLWAKRVASGPLVSDEASSFGWWFSSGQMGEAWSMKMLGHLLRERVLPEPDHMVVERLAEMAPHRPGEAVFMLDQMIELAAPSWGIHGWLDGAKAILAVALQSDDPQAREHADRVVQKLGALRYSVFRDLMALKK